MRRVVRAAVVAAVLGTAPAAVTPGIGPAGASPANERVSVDVFGGDPERPSFSPSVSEDGRFVAFASAAGDLVETDLNDATDVFVRDREAGTTVMATLSADDQPTSGGYGPQLADTGTVVAFWAFAEIAPGPGTSDHDLFARDLAAGTTERVNLLPDGTPTALVGHDFDLSGNGRYVVFTSVATGSAVVYRRDLVTDTTEALFQGTSPSVDDGGHRVAFDTNRARVAADTNGARDVYLWREASRSFTLVSRAQSGNGGNADSFRGLVSGDGTAVAFESKATDLSDVVPHDHASSDLFVRDLAAGTTAQVNLTLEGADTVAVPRNPGLSDDGSLVTFTTRARGYVADDDNEYDDVFVVDLPTGVTWRASTDVTGDDGNHGSAEGALSGDGRLVAWSSWADDLVAGDDNGTSDVFAAPVDVPAPSAPVLSVGSVRMLEGGNGKARPHVPVVLSRPSDEPVTFGFAWVPGTATSPEDFEAHAGTWEIPPGEVTALVGVDVRGDTVVEGDESFTLEVSGVTGAAVGDRAGTLTLLDDEVPTVAVGDVAVAEGTGGDPHVVVPVRLQRPAAEDVAVAFATADGTATAGLDYAATSGTLTIPAGRANGRVEVTLLGDTADGGDEHFTVELSDPHGALLADGSGRVTVRDDDPSAGLTVAVGDVTAPEGDPGPTGYAQFPVVLSAPAPAPLVVEYTTADGTAVAPGDYTAAAGSVTIPQGSTWGTIAVRVEGDQPSEPDEAFTVTVTGVSAGSVADGQGTGTIADDDADRLLSVADVTVVEGDDGLGSVSVAVTLERPAAVRTELTYTLVSGSATVGQDVTAASGTATIRRGQRSTEAVVVTVLRDQGSDAATESFSVVVTGADHARLVDPVGTVTLVDDDSP